MTDTTFNVSPGKERKPDREVVDFVANLRNALLRPIEQHWLPRSPVIACNDPHALLNAMCYAFNDHLPLRLTPDALWITLARGFALHEIKNAEGFRHRFTGHSDRERINVHRMDFVPGALTATEPFKFFFDYEEYLVSVPFIGCGIPQITLAGTEQDWDHLRRRVHLFADYGLDDWIEALDPILQQFCDAKQGKVDLDFWKSMFRYHSGPGSPFMTGWANVLFPYFKYADDQLYANPYLKDWKRRLDIYDGLRWRRRRDNTQGMGFAAIPNCVTSVPLKVCMDKQEVDMRLVSGLLVVTRNETTEAVEPECGWVVTYESPVYAEPTFMKRYERKWKFPRLPGAE